MKIVASLAAVLLLAGTEAYAQSKFHLEEATIEHIQQAILARQITTEQLVRLYLARIKAYNGTCVEQPQGHSRTRDVRSRTPDRSTRCPR